MIGGFAANSYMFPCSLANALGGRRSISAVMQQLPLTGCHHRASLYGNTTPDL
jgi:hypothetical protein